MPITLQAHGREPTAAPVRFSEIREARLRPECVDLYPGLRAGQWEAAAIIADRLLADRLIRGSHAALLGRVLPDEHFEFRGGAARGGEREGMRQRREGI